MGDPDDILTQIDLDSLSDKDFTLFGDDFSSHHLLTTEDDSPCCIEQQVSWHQQQQLETPSPPPPPPPHSWTIHHIEQILMKDDENVLAVVEEEEEENQYLCKDIFFSDLLVVDSPVLDQSNAITTIANVVSNPESNVSDESEDKENNSDAPAELKNKRGEIDNDDPITKKRKRQMRNRDAALRSRERKKLYVRDLEMKSRFLESECTRLQHLLHCYAAENQKLHLHLQKNKAFDASMAKQESAVLLLESLLLGSLLWLLGIVCLFSLPGLLIYNPNPCPDDVVVKVGSNNLVEPAALRAGNKRGYLGMVWAFFKKRRWKARRTTRSKMKILFSSGSDIVPRTVLV